MKLSHRLKTIYDQAIPQAPLWDLCCDHGLLGLYAYEAQNFPEINFVDQVPTIMQHLESIFKSKFLNALNPSATNFITEDAGELKTPLTGTVVIAGVGGLNMREMLINLQKKQLLTASRLVLAPHRDEALYQNPDFLPDYILKEELSVLENGKLRLIFVFDLKN